MKRKIRWTLLIYDTIVFLVSAFFILVVYPSSVDRLSPQHVTAYMIVGLLCVLAMRTIMRIYEQIWRYAGSSQYICLIISDIISCMIFLFLRNAFSESPTFVRTAALFMLNLLGCIALRHVYQLAYQKRNSNSRFIKALLSVLFFFTRVNFADEKPINNRTKVAIIGAGSNGAMLADELLQNSKSRYNPVCFVDIDKEKIGRKIGSLPVISSNDNLEIRLKDMSVQEVIFALPNATKERRLELFMIYKNLGYNIKTYSYQALNTGEPGTDKEKRNTGPNNIHDFNIEDLLFRESRDLLSEETITWYKGKAVLITGGGGSIGSELARQIARCNPSRLMILDVYENGAYEIEQELKTRYANKLNMRIEIINICDRELVDKLFREHTPDIVLHVAAHKHVPLMERNVIECVNNNVFGTLNLVDACEKYNVGRFIMISTDKAVNPTNVMGATKRLCEMIVLSRSGSGTSFSATRFGNVLGSNGSVVPLFRRQIENGGPVTVTDKRITRYFMTISEASQLVLTSGAMAKNGELYVLDMGNPVKIIDLAESMIHMNGLEPYTDIEIAEIGLRPGEKLYEELLIRTEELYKTDNNKIFIEKDKPFSREEIRDKLKILKNALDSGSNRAVKQAIMDIVPTYRKPEEVNREALEAANVGSPQKPVDTAFTNVEI